MYKMPRKMKQLEWIQKLPSGIAIYQNLHLRDNPNQVPLGHFWCGTETITKKPNSFNMIKGRLLQDE